MDEIEFLEQYLSPGALTALESARLSPEQRERVRAKRLMRSGQFAEALKIWQSLEASRDKIFLLEELICLYQLGLFYDWNKRVHEVRQLHAQGYFKSLRQPELRHRVLYLVAKILEEGGWLAESLEIMKGLGENPSFKPVADAYELRLSLQYRIPSPRLAELYRSLVAFQAAPLEVSASLKGKFDSDIQHAIALYEAKGVSERLALHRGERVLSYSRIQQDASWILVDLLEMAYEAELDVAALLAKCRALDLNVYERKVVEFLETGRIEDPLFLFSQMPTANALRLAALAMRHLEEDLLAALCLEIIRGLGAENRSLWRSYLGLREKSLSQSLELIGSHLVVGSTRIALTPILAKLLEVLSKSQGSLPTESAIDELWREAAGTAQVERLKSATHRLNKLLKVHGGIERALVFSKTELKLASGLRLTCSDESPTHRSQWERRVGGEH